jgi:RNA polymerase sigma-70 factor (ECF subfamily)
MLRQYMPLVEIREVELRQHTAAETGARQVIIRGLYEQYYDRIVRYIFVRINDRSEAENLAGDVFLRALQSLDSYRGRKEQMQVWLFRIAHNRVIDYLRKMSKRGGISTDEVEITDRVNMEDVLEAKLEVKRLTKALQQLTSAQREVIGLRFFAGLSSGEVSKILGKSNGAVRQMQRAAVEALRKQMYV